MTSKRGRRNGGKKEVKRLHGGKGLQQEIGESITKIQTQEIYKKVPWKIY